MVEAVIFGSLFAATVVRRRSLEIGLTLGSAALWILLAAAAQR
jgi:hypothetical protein